MKKILLAVVAVVLLVAAGLVAFGLYRKHQGQDVRGSSTEEFVTTTQPAPKPVKPQPKIRWPMYRFDPSRQANAERMLVQPPYKTLWFFRAGSLVEFPPAAAYGRLYFANSTGTLFALDTSSVKVRWAYRAHRCTAASPAVDNHTVYMTFLNKPPCNATRSGLDGEVVAINADTGKVRWKLRIGPSESSPLVLDGVVYVGDWNGKLYALDRRLRGDALDVHGRRQDQGRRRLRGRPALRRLVRPPRLRPERPHREARSGAAPRNSGSDRAAPSTRPRPSPTGASTSARPTARSTRSARRAARCAGRTAPAATSTRSPAV